MNSKGHNKKRNAGLLYEFLVRTISRALVEDAPRRSNVALRLVRRHFRPGTELHREFRLINSLLRTTVSSEAVAASILQEAKAAARSHDVAQLDKEKSLLISNINRAINDDDFYDQQINEYRMYATIQTLLNGWRTPGADICKLATYEDQLLQWLVAVKAPPAEQPLSEDSPGSSRLLMKVMMKRLNEKYSGALNDDQRALVRAYAFSTANDDASSIKLKLAEIRQRLLVSIDAFVAQGAAGQHVESKLAEARSRLEQETLEAVDDDTVTRFMLYARLGTELASEDA